MRRAGILVLVLSAALAAATPAWGAGGTVTGKLVDPSGAGVPYVDVHLEPVGPDAEGRGYGFSAADGTWTATGVPAGRYTVDFAPHDGHVRTFFPTADSARTATPITVREGETLTGIGATLPRGGTITGKVTDAAGRPLERVSVIPDLEPVAGADHREPSTWTRADGTYAVVGLRPGLYTVGFSGDGERLGEYWPGRPTSSGARLVRVAADATTGGIDARLATPATVSGRILGSNGSPLAGALVLVDREPPTGFPQQASTGSDGRYAVTGVRPGRTSVRITPPLASQDVRMFLGGTETADGSTTVDAPDGGTVEAADARLAPGRTVRGRVVDARGAPVRDVRVSAARSGTVFERLRDVYTDASGSYAIGGLAPGSYAIAFQPAFGNLVAQYAGGAAAIADAAPVLVGADADVAGIDATLADGARISGRITEEAGGAPLQYANATVLPAVPDELLDFHATRFSGADGRYEVVGLRPGSYTVRFDSPAGRDMAIEFAGNAEQEDDAPRVDVTAGGGAVVDAALHDTNEAPRPGALAGRVTGPDGAPIAGARVTPMTPTGGERTAVLTAADGTWRSGDLAAGTYRVRVSAAGRPGEFFDDAASLGSSRAIQVRASQTTAPVDVSLGATSLAPGAPAPAPLTTPFAPVAPVPAEPGPVQPPEPDPDPLPPPTTPQDPPPSAPPTTPQDPPPSAPPTTSQDPPPSAPPTTPQDPSPSAPPTTPQDPPPTSSPTAPQEPLAAADQGPPPAYAPALESAFRPADLVVGAAAGGPVAPGAPLAPPAFAAPRVLVPASGRAAVRDGAVPVRLSCSGGLVCRGTLRLVRAEVTLASARFVVPAGGRATVRARLTARGRRLARGRAVRVQVTLPGGTRHASLVLVR